MRDTLDTNAPPSRLLTGGREYYLPEVFYFFDSKEVAVDVAMRVTAACVVQWCDRYLVPATSSQRSRAESKRDYPGREGPLPPTVPERRQILQELFDWLVQTRGPLGLDVDLFDGEEAILYQEGVLFGLTLTSPQFAELQDWWEAHGLPRDLFYPSAQQREVVEPVAWLGSVVQMTQRYTPHRWATRVAAEVEAVPVPTEAERERAFLDACERFNEAILLRRMELQEPGKQASTVELHRLNLLANHVGQYRLSMGAQVPDSELHQMREDFWKSYATVYNLTE